MKQSRKRSASGSRGPPPDAKNGGGSINKEIQILVVDDHPVVRYGLVGHLSVQPDFNVVGEAGSSADCLEKLASLSPDVVLLDLEMGDASGVEALSRLRDTYPDMPTIVYTAHGSDWRVVEAIRVGVEGYLMKDAPIEKLFDAIRMVHRGGSYLDPMVTSKVMGAVGGKHHRQGAPLGTLSTRETTVLQMMAEGKRNKDISEALHISERTVKFHVSSMLGKLQASNRTEAVVVAAEQGIIRI